MALVTFVEFFLFAFIGWILDSSFRSLIYRRLTSSGYFPGIPLCPLYGFGGILLLQTLIQMYGYPPLSTILVGTFVLIGVEYLGGVLAERYLHERLWDYSAEPLNIDGYISLFHSVIWLVLVTATVLYVSPVLFSLHRLLTLLLRPYASYELPILMLAVFVAIPLTMLTQQTRVPHARRLPRKRA